ncbi:MAG: transposase [Cyanophyceae cyanobacterium]
MTLEEFIAHNPDSRELKRAVAVQMRLQGLKHREIQMILGVASSYISHWEQRYQADGVRGLRLAHKGSQGYLSPSQRAEVIDWLKSRDTLALEELIEYIESHYGVSYRSLASYYELLKAAGMSWHKGRKKVPNAIEHWCRSTIQRSPVG